MKKLATNILIALTIIPLLGSCGKSESGSGIQLQQEEIPEGSVDGSTIDGVYMAKFTTLNPHVNGTIPGSLTFYRNKDRLMAYVRLFAGGPRVWHQQGVYLGTRCPEARDDLNNDGFIDIEEAMKVVGKVIIPLDANLNSQDAGKNFYPVADLSGYYHYERIASFNRMFDDLKGVDRDPNDHITKLGPDDTFTFEGRVVMVQGISEEVLLPETVSGLGRRKPFQTLPITCGIIKKVEGHPGVPDSGEIPGPVGEVIEGQDRPAEVGENEDTSTTSGTGSGNTGTNENEDGEVSDSEGRRTSGGSGGTTSGGTTSGGTTSGGTTSGGTTSGGTTSGGTTSGGTTGETPSEEENTSGGIIGGFVGGFIGGRGGSGGSSGGNSDNHEGTTSGGIFTAGEY